MPTFRYPEFSPGFLLMLAAMVLMLPLGWCVAILFAALFHEMCHLLALRLCGATTALFQIHAGGAAIMSTPLPIWKVLICTLAGPLSGILLIPLAKWFPRLALCAAAQTAFNLLPLSSLDGGHILRCILELFLQPSTADKLCNTVEFSALFLIAILGFYGTFVLKLGMIPFLAAGILILKGRNGKIPCK